jgi:hypothetical protein
MISPTCKIIKKFDDANTLDRILRELKSYRARVGFLVGSGTHPGSDLPTATIAVYNEFGTPTARHPIPARPFMRPVFRNTVMQKAEMRKIMPGTIFCKDGERLRKSPRVEMFFRLYAMSMTAKVQDMIRSNIPPENADWTKNVKGLNKTQTLIDTGAMLQAVSFEVIK